MASIEDLLRTVSLDDLATLSTIKSVGMVDGKRDVDLNDPSVYTTVEVEPALPPEGAKVVNIGRDLNKSQELVGENVGENKFLDLLKGLLDYKSSGLFNPISGFLPGSDYDKKGDFFGENPLSGYGRKWDQEKENRLAEQKKRADLSGTPTLTKQQAIDSLPGRRVLDAYEAEKRKALRDEELKYFMAIYPGLADMINDEIYKQRMRIELNSPSEILGRINKSRTNYIDAIRGRAEAQERIANATAMGLGRYSGIRNVAG
tara:strand:+ start:279 stop:1058 length:780 start_codon:yes stop_codon:yes gene_type:complete